MGGWHVSLLDREYELLDLGNVIIDAIVPGCAGHAEPVQSYLRVTPNASFGDEYIQIRDDASEKFYH